MKMGDRVEDRNRENNEGYVFGESFRRNENEQIKCNDPQRRGGG